MQDPNKRTVLAFYDAITTGALGTVGDLVAADFPGGAAALQATLAELRAAFPDIRYTVTDLIAEGDRVVARFAWTGTHRGAFRGYAPTGKVVADHGIAIYTLRDARITAAALETDRLGFLQQIGVVPGDDVLRAGLPVVDTRRAPTGVYLVDTFHVPASARAELEAAMQRNRAFIRTLEGFRGDAVFVRTQGDSFDIATIAAWESPAAIARAKDQVAAFYHRIGFDMPAAIARWGVTLQRTICEAPAALQ